MFKVYTFMIEDKQTNCRRTCPRDVRYIFFRYAKRRFWEQWADKNHIDELHFDIWFEPIKTFIPKKCTEVWANTCSESEVLGGERTADASQVTRPWYKVQTDECPLCHQKGAEQHPFFHCQGWWTVCNAKGGRGTTPWNMRWMHPARRGCGKEETNAQ